MTKPSRPVSIIRLLEPFGTIFQAKTWEKAQLLLVGAILSPGKRTVTSALRVMGLSRDGNFARYHHVLNRARWSSLQLSRTLLFLLLRHLDSGIGPLVFGIDETIERRRGKRISAKGIYRDGVRSSQGHFVKASGLRWVSLMWLAPIPWAGRVWALPFLTVLAPSERFHRERGQRHRQDPHRPGTGPGRVPARDVCGLHHRSSAGARVDGGPGREKAAEPAEADVPPRPADHRRIGLCTVVPNRRGATLRRFQPAACGSRCGAR